MCYHALRENLQSLMGRLAVHATFRWLLIALAAALLVACTRERPTPEPTTTAAVPVSEPAERATRVLEPEVVGTTPEATADAAATPAALQLATPTPVPQDTFQYTVQEGDTLSTIATRFGTDVGTIRTLNNLDSDALYVGQPIYVPYVEGMSAEGMPTPTPGPFYYTVETGDTLSGIAAAFGVSTIAIVEANNLLDPNNLTVGSTILIPEYQPEPGEVSADAAAGAAAGGDSASADNTGEVVLHVVQTGEGLITIAETYGVSPDAIADANNLADRNNLRVGQQLIIPGLTPRDAATARGSIHVVQAGESLLGIAVQYGVTVEEIMTANNIANPDAIAVGQELIIPGN
jgi:LysM repeat protein